MKRTAISPARSPRAPHLFRAAASWVALSAALAGAGFLGGCASILPPAAADPTRYFVLTSPAGAPGGGALAAGGSRVGLRSLELPDYLRTTKNVVVRTGANEVRFEDFARWAEPLNVGLARVIRETLLAAPNVAGVETAPLRSDVKRDYDLFVRVVRCEGVAGAEGRGTARFSAVYEIVAADGSGRVRVKKNFVAPDAAWDGRDIGALAQLLSDAVAVMSAQIAVDLGS